MSKTVQASKLTEWKGLDRISTIVHKMGNIWREMTKDDFGLDGEIEVVTPKASGKGFETTGGIVKVQSKAGESYVRYDMESSFSTPVDQNDLEYWQKCTFPVLFIVYHPKDDKLYFKEVKAYIRDTPGVFSKPHHIKFDKTKDEFSASSKDDVCQHAKVSPPRISFEQQERLFTNLLPIKTLPETLYYATTRRKNRQNIRDEIEGFVPPYCIVDGRLFSLSDLGQDQCSLNKFCTGKVDTKLASEWIVDKERVNDFIFLLNQLLGKHIGRCGVRYNRDFGRNYFPRENTTDTAFKRVWTSVRTGVADERTVVKYYEYGKDKFWRHLASEMSFERFSGEWFLRIMPKYFFTEDGEKPWDSELVGPYTTSLKADEHNSQVLNHVLFWADVLAFRKATIDVILDGMAIMQIEKMPLTGIAPFAIPDDPATYEEKAPSFQMSLFDFPDDDEKKAGLMLEIEYLPEPKLQFGSYFEHEDSKTGLAEFGPFGKNVSGLHPSEITLGFIGTRETITGAKEWIDELRSPIESENRKRIKNPVKKIDLSPNLFGAGIIDDEPPQDESFIRVYKILNRDFIGFSPETPFKCSFQMNDRWDRILQPHEIKVQLDVEDKEKRIWDLVNLFDDQIKSLAETKPSPDIIILALTPEMVDEAHAVRVTGNFYLNFRRAIKAKAMKWGIPIQLIQRNTVLGKKGKGRKGPLQEKATRAWNFCTALYYKADGVPWRPTSFQQETCFVGIDFYVARELNDRLTMRSSVAQAFDYLGQGLVLRGDPFEWDDEKDGRSPHMTKDGAKKLMRATLDEYIRVKGSTPKRVVVHKSSRFWGRDHGEHNELEGFQEGIHEVFPKIESDLVTLSQFGVKLFREGMYPPLRGIYFRIGDDHHYLYTMGFIPYLATYPGPYVPDPWHIVEHHGGSSKKDLFREVLELTKMNVNNCSFADGTPITLAFAGKVGEIMKHIPEGESMQTGYKFYM